MGYASRSGRAKTDAKNPRAFGVCDRCSMWQNHDTLSWQMDWAGASLINKRLLVCRTCYDEPQQQLRAIVVPADPVPIQNPRVEPYTWDQTDTRQVSGANTVNQQTGIPVPRGDTRVTTAASAATTNSRVTQQTGEAPGGKNQLPGTDPNAVSYRTISSVFNNGGFIYLTVVNTGGFITGQQVIVGGVLGVTAANGSWVITVVDLTTIKLDGSVFSGSYTSGGYLINDPSVPYGFTEVPATGPL